ncbi:hypothetical protein DPMN_138195 [Dreissena polymorpha]|uniref:Uncharacterized protein n=1 Tax=Dreissena polymorpha TaxID=45954 RepID=A0A9D4G3C4_DREPO|nr:hypothetical protein DPMN_138195 [Dreissena polymorpha]
MFTFSEDNKEDNLCSPMRPVTLKLLVSVDLHRNGDDEKEPLLTGLDFMPDGRLVAVDSKNDKCIIPNERLQRQGKPYKCRSRPNDFACISENHIIVSVANTTLCVQAMSSA